MIIAIGNFKENSVVEVWLNDCLTLRPLLIPKLQLAAVLRFPILVEIDDESKSAAKPRDVVRLSIDVNVELCTDRHHAVSRALQIGIRQQTPDTGDFGEEVQECG